MASIELTQANLTRYLKAENIAKLALLLRGISILVIFIVCVLVTRELIARRVSNVVTSIEDPEVPTTNSTGSSNTNPDIAGTSKKSYREISTRNIFGSLLKTDQPQQQVVAPKPISPLALALTGTFVSQGTEPFAIIENKKKNEQESFMLNEMIFDEAKLVAIFNDRVEIERNGEIEVLKLDETAASINPAGAEGGVVSVGEDQFVVSGAELDKALENMPLLLQQARAVPYFKDGRSIGLRLFAVRPDSLFSKLGLRNGDILKNVNGSSLADLSQALKLFEQLKSERAFGVELERNQETKQLRYEIK